MRGPGELYDVFMQAGGRLEHVGDVRAPNGKVAIENARLKFRLQWPVVEERSNMEKRSIH